MDTKQNAAGSFNEEREVDERFLTINTIEQTVFVERLPNPLLLSRAVGDVLRYGYDNLYINKVKTMIERSKSAVAAIAKLSEFTTGQGFTEESLNTLVINRQGQTLFDILGHFSDEKAPYKGLAVHFNFNVFGEIIEIQEIPFETMRWKKDFSRLVFCPDWSKSGRFGDNRKIEYFPFNPETVKDEIKEVGIEKYPGQVIYWIPKRKQIYTLARCDAALDDIQFQHESGIYKLRNVQNGYSANYVVFYPAALETELEKRGLISDTKSSRGGKNAGKTKHIPLNASAMEAMKGRKFIEEIPRTGIDKLFTKQNEETKLDIFAIFNQPPILSGISKDGMFNAESFVDAFDYYNSVTERDRQQIERIFNKFMPLTIWNVQKVEIKPLEFMIKRDKAPEPITPTE